MSRPRRAPRRCGALAGAPRGRVSSATRTSSSPGRAPAPSRGGSAGRGGADGRGPAEHGLVLGGRGAPSRFGSRIDPAYDREPVVFAGLRDAVTELFPGLGDHRFTHAWGGPLGIARDWRASVGLDAATGL